MSAGEDEGLERQHVLKDRLGCVAHFNAEDPLDAARENVARQLRKGQRRLGLHGFHIGTLDSDIVFDERPVVTGVEKVPHLRADTRRE